MKLTVYKNQYGFSTLAKNGDDKTYISVQFKRGTEPAEEKTTINILDAFFSTYKDRNGVIKPKLVVMEYTTNDAVTDAFDIDVSADDLPF